MTIDPDVTDLDWLMRRVYDCAVGIGADCRYYVTLSRAGGTVDCDDQVYQLEDLGLVVLEPDGPVSVSAKWRRQYDADCARRKAERKVELRAERKALREDVFLAPTVQAAA